MSGYRCVNYLELCRLCTASNGAKINIFSEEGKRKALHKKIIECLPVIINENDKLPKILCANCLTQIETITRYRETCINAQNMLESCLNSAKLSNGGKVYIKDVSSKKSSGTSVITSTSLGTATGTITTPSVTKPIPIPNVITSPTLVTTQKTETPSVVAEVVPPATTTKLELPLGICKLPLNSNCNIQHSNNQNNSDFLSTIIHAVGIQNIDDNTNENSLSIHQQPQQYTINLDDKFQYAIEQNSKIDQIKQYSAFSQVDEFLRLKPSVQKNSVGKHEQLNTINMETISVSKQQQQQPQQQINILIASSPQNNNNNNKVGISPTTSISNQNQTIALQDLKLFSPSSKCYFPISIKDDQIVAQIDSKNVSLPPNTYLQMKIPQQITTIDGQQIIHLNPTSFQNTFNLPSGTQIQSTNKLKQHQIITQSPVNNANVLSNITVKSSSNNKVKTINPGNITPNVTLKQMNDSIICNITTLQNNITNANTITVSNAADVSGGGVSGEVQYTTLQNVISPNIIHPIQQKSDLTIQKIKTERKAKTTTVPKNKNVSTETITIPAIKKTAVKKNNITVNSKIQSNKLTPTITSSALTNVTEIITSPTTAATIVTPTTTTTTTTTTIPSNMNNVYYIDGLVKPIVPTCEVCEKVFKRKEHLAQHMKLHLGLRPFKCEQALCDKSFSRKEHLMRHLVSHTGKKMFCCPICEKLFSRKDNLNKHKRNHEGKSTIVFNVKQEA